MGATDLDRDGAISCCDCNDNDAAQSPYLQERSDADDIDEDCDGNADDADGIDGDTLGAQAFYVDDDRDGFGGYGLRYACDAEDGLVTVGGDCDDTNRSTNPGVTETPNDGADSNRDGTDNCYIDADGDGYGGTTTGLSADFSCRSGGFVTSGGDCDCTGPA